MCLKLEKQVQRLWSRPASTLLLPVCSEDVHAHVEMRSNSSLTVNSAMSQDRGAGAVSPAVQL